MTLVVVYLLVGKVVIFAIQKFPFVEIPLIGRFFEKGKFLEQLLSCDFCLGFWVYSILALVFNINYLDEYFYIPVLSQALTGLISSFIVHLVSLGWKDKFGTFILE